MFVPAIFTTCDYPNWRRRNPFDFCLQLGTTALLTAASA